MPDIEVGSVQVSKLVRLFSGESPVEGEIEVRLAEGTEPAEVAIDADTFRPLFPRAPADELLARWFVVTVPEGSEAERARSYSKLNSVEVAAEEGSVSAERAPTDPMFANGTQTNVRTARLTAAWEVRQTGGNRPIAIIDTGVRVTHEDLNGVVLQNHDVTGTGVQPCDFHGTHVASIAGAIANNGAGTADASWGGPLGAYKVFNTQACDNAPNNLLAQAIDNAWRDGFWVLNMSLSGPNNDQAVRDAINRAWAAGRFLVAAAGNEGGNAMRFPAANDNVFSVANSNADDTRAANSNFGAWVDLAAPGVNVPGASNCADNCYVTISGTSMATPLVSGTAAILMENGVANGAMAAALQSTADPVYFGNNGIAGGRLNAYRAIRGSRFCLRDLPTGLTYASPTGAIYLVDGSGKRAFPDLATYTSWYGSESAATCSQRLAELRNGATAGFRPGSLIRNSAGGIFLVTGDGGDFAKSTIRGFTTAAVYSCLGFGPFPTIAATDADIALHAQGAPISSCGTVRTHPNGSLVRSPAGTIFMVRGGKLRGFPSANTLASWKFTHSIGLTATEYALYQQGPNMGFRPGTLISNGAVFVVGTLGDPFSGQRRTFATPNAITERGIVAQNFAATAGEVALHPLGAGVLDADAMP